MKILFDINMIRHIAQHHNVELLNQLKLESDNDIEHVENFNLFLNWIADHNLEYLLRAYNERDNNF